MVPMNRPITYAFGNDGRDNRPGSTTPLDLDLLRSLRDSVPDTRSAVFLCEINEGDDNNELALVREVFKGWRLYGRNTHEPILLTPDLRAKASVLWIPGTAVPHWSPARSLLTVNLLDEPISLLGMHYPAGSHGQGDRPAWALPLLNAGWDHCRHTHVRHLHGLHKRGRNAVWMMDANAYDYTHLPLIGGEETVVHEHTDWGRVLPAHGYKAQFKALDPVPFKVDTHDGQRMRGRFVPVS